jgi:hypothetical protein
MSKRLLALTVMLLVLVGGNALAHHKDTHPDDSKRCDSWWRDGYGSPSNPNDHDTHDNAGTPEPTYVTVGGPDNTMILAEGGHYVIYGDSGYIEVVGGQSYARPNNSNGSRGGWVQGEIDIAGAPTDVDFLVGSFLGAGGTDPTYAEKDACVNANNTRVVDLMQCTKPPLATNPNCT